MPDIEITLTFSGGNVSYRIGNESKIGLNLTETEYNLLLGLAELSGNDWILPYDDAYKIVYYGEENLSNGRCPDNLAKVISRTRKELHPYGEQIIVTVHTRGLKRGFKPEFID